MTAKQVIREELRTLKERRAGLETQIGALENALAALNGAVPARGRSSTPTPRTREYKGRASGHQRRQQILDTLRAHPDRGIAPAEFQTEFGIPQSSVIAQLEDHLIPEGKVNVIGETPGGKAIVKHKPRTVRPGEEVQG